MLLPTFTQEHPTEKVTPMRFSPTKLLHGLLYTAPVILLTLVACGGGGGSTPTAPIVPSYYLGGNITGLSSSGLILRNNGGDDKTILSADTSYTFSTQLTAGTNYTVTVLTQPSNSNCLVSNASTTMPAYNMPDATGPNVDVTCSPANTVGGTAAGGGGITGLTGTGLVLQNGGGDNYLVTPAGGTIDFTFNTPVIDGSYIVSILTQPNGQSCTVTNPNVTVSGVPINDVAITCGAGAPPADSFAYTANFGASPGTVSGLLPKDPRC